MDGFTPTIPVISYGAAGESPVLTCCIQAKLRFHDLGKSKQASAIMHSSRRIPAEVRLDLLAKNQGHIASGVFQQFLATNTNLGAKLQTLQQVNEQTASHLGRGCAGQTPRLYLPLETFRENIS